MYFIIGEFDGYIEAKDGNKHLVYASTDIKQTNIDKIRKTLELT